MLSKFIWCGQAAAAGRLQKEVMKIKSWLAAVCGIVIIINYAESWKRDDTHSVMLC